jgi:hypothetical protein
LSLIPKAIKIRSFMEAFCALNRLSPDGLSAVSPCPSGTFRMDATSNDGVAAGACAETAIDTLLHRVKTSQRPANRRLFRQLRLTRSVIIRSRSP